MRKYFAVAGLLVLLTAATWLSWQWLKPSQPGFAKSKQPIQNAAVEPDLEVVKLVQQLYESNNKVELGPTIIPGGELLWFSNPMIKLIRIGDRARPALHEKIKDSKIQNEVVLILGAIGDSSTVSLLIDEYPEEAVQVKNVADPRWMSAMCFTFALTYLTGEPIGRSRWGADCDPNNRNLWKEWWRQRGANFAVPKTKPNATWVPRYPAG